MSNQLINTPIGWLNVVASVNAITAIEFDADPDLQQQPSETTEQCCLQLAEYFNGQREKFDVELDMAGTAFQQTVWQALNGIGYGDTCSYGDIANDIGNPKAVRAVGAANGKNPVPIIVPCHRVIGSSGKLTGYAGGLDIKVWLLEHEKLHFVK
ncbi:methylated-DNA--[protein]-cysteine S-methyltransferase [Photobacterium sp. ZSDE20]|uniref:Methylated-DNA--protein-cysteine methyltransferase n=1 Tax=Photobacterium pectinilyticum TaxID=2906793 RepID=A0ABT1N8W7_9GAMM|nr:methylated-DNA--[protein]-cysteine S-methyltransferase [Photobacterium sp. ZSDE20]MCQ1060552.1 methylated-DNA--[protein]-cysteine S-methyltransferase [Photobacterium sp. ZSDE20]MDD1828017.1 methylated-DNA--[protein]-cysteine S-methyltransferase [Photobacterium sp. ZSDE20]